MITRRGFLSLGSNLRDRRENLRRALAALGEHEAIKLGRISGVYETAPVGVTEQPDFLNLVAEIETALSGRELLGAVKEIERNLGRSAGPRWGARKIDIDILLLEEENIVTEELQIPHASMLERAFVMAPLAELEPDMKTPSGETVAEAAARLGREQRVHANLHL